MSYVHPVELHSLSILMPKLLGFFSGCTVFKNYPSLELHHEFIYAKCSEGL